MIGTLLGNRYELLEKIGEGGMAEVYKAKCHLLNRFVAVKVLKDEYSKDKDFVDKFKAEAAAAGSISHTNIVNIYDVGSQDNINYIIMEYVNGRTLKELIIQNGRLDYNRALDFSIQIAKALECAHKNNIIHRDIKPQNILVTDDGTVKVTDFGIAKAANSVTITNTNKVLGSAHYFSPEQAKGTFVDARTDIYSLGVVLYEMTTGKVPYDAESPVSVALKHIQEPVVAPKLINNNVPEGLNNLIVKSMQKDPINRYQNIRDVILDLQRIKNNSDYKVELGSSNDEFTKIMSPVSDVNNEFEDDDKTIKKSGKKLAMILIPLAILVIVAGFFSGWYFKSLKPKSTTQSSGKTVTVPKIIGSGQAEAKKSVEDAGLQFVVAETQKSDKPEGTIISCSPDQGTSVNTNTEVRVVVSSGLITSGVPNLKEIDLKSAQDMIKNFGFQVGDITYENNDTIQKDSVIRQNPDADTPAEKNAKINLVVSQGPKIKYAAVPDLMNKTVTEATALLKNSNLQLGKQTEIPTDKPELNGRIANQNYGAQQQVKEGTLIDITVYTYKEPDKVNVPDFTGKTFDQAKTLAFQYGLNVVAQDNKTSGTVSDFSPKNQQVPKGTTITLVFTDQTTTGSTP